MVKLFTLEANLLANHRSRHEHNHKTLIMLLDMSEMNKIMANR